MAVVDLCRITVRTHCPSATGAVDLTLPTRRELGEILPDIVELAGEKSEASGERCRGAVGAVATRRFPTP